MLVAHKMVDFARKTNRNLHVWDSLPYPTQSFFTPYPQRVYWRAYADVATKFSRMDRLPNLLSNEATLARAWSSAMIVGSSWSAAMKWGRN